MIRMLKDKRGVGPWWGAAISPLIWLIIIIVALVAGGIFLKDVKTQFTNGFQLNNPYLWVIGALVLILLIKKSSSQPPPQYYGGYRRY